MRNNKSQSGFTVVHAIAGIASVLALTFCVLWFAAKREVALDVAPDVPQASGGRGSQEGTNKIVKKATGQLTVEQKRAIAAEVWEDAKPLEPDKLLASIPRFSLVFVVDDALLQFARKSELQDKCELLLRRNGIPIEKNAPNTLHVTLGGSWNAADSILLYEVQLKVFQNAGLFRNGIPYSCEAIIWEDATFGYTGTTKAHSYLHASLERVTDSFAIAYLKANAKTK